MGVLSERSVVSGASLRVIVAVPAPCPRHGLPLASQRIRNRLDPQPQSVSQLCQHCKPPWPLQQPHELPRWPAREPRRSWPLALVSRPLDLVSSRPKDLAVLQSQCAHPSRGRLLLGRPIGLRQFPSSQVTAAADFRSFSPAFPHLALALRLLPHRAGSAGPSCSAGPSRSAA